MPNPDASVPDAPDQLALTGERTVPGIAAENYWFRRHEVVYQRVLERCAGMDVLEAGPGEGYGAAMLAEVAASVTALDYDESAIAHIKANYPRVDARLGNLAELPFPDASFDTVVNFQVIEHLWDQPGFLAEALRVLRPGGELLISTPNRITFSPGRDIPLNPFHTRELDPAELQELLERAGFVDVVAAGLHPAPRLRELDARWDGSLINAQLDRSLAGIDWPDELLADVVSITVDDFVLGGSDLDDSLDLVSYARRPRG